MLKLTVKSKMIFGFSGVLALMGAISLISAERVGFINKNLEEVANGATLKQRYAINFRGSVHDRAISIRDAIIVDNDNELNKHLNDIEKLKSFYLFPLIFSNFCLCSNSSI